MSSRLRFGSTHESGHHSFFPDLGSITDRSANRQLLFAFTYMGTAVVFVGMYQSRLSRPVVQSEINLLIMETMNSGLFIAISQIRWLSISNPGSWLTAGLVHPNEHNCCTHVGEREQQLPVGTSVGNRSQIREEE